jgi:hypothetical protein
MTFGKLHSCCNLMVRICRRFGLFAVLVWLVCLFIVEINADYSHATGGQVSLRGSSESWTRDWVIEDSARRSPQGLKPGFYRRLPSRLNISISGRATGLACIIPESRHKPAQLLARRFLVTEKSTHLFVRAAAARSPRGQWEFRLIINSEAFAAPFLIDGRDGWVNLVFNISAFTGERIDILIEAWETGRGREPSAFFDVITWMDRNANDTYNKSESENGPDIYTGMDEYYKTFIETLQKREEERWMRYMEQHDYYR